jgi:DNA-directed RNA polymerase subunit RPC12/RpoP
MTPVAPDTTLPKSFGEETAVTLTATCPQCGYRAEAPDGAAGGAVACPECAARFLLPRPAPANNATLSPAQRRVPLAPPGQLQPMWIALIILVGLMFLGTLFMGFMAALSPSAAASDPVLSLTTPLWIIAVTLAGYVICRAIEAIATASGPGRQGGSRD